MNKDFKQWLDANKLSIVAGSDYNSFYPKYSMLPIVFTTIYNPNTFEAVKIYRMVTKEHYDRLITSEDLKYNDGRLIKF